MSAHDALRFGDPARSSEPERSAGLPAGGTRGCSSCERMSSGAAMRSGELLRRGVPSIVAAPWPVALGTVVLDRQPSHGRLCDPCAEAFGA